jgi:hypothetical protein
MTTIAQHLLASFDTTDDEARFLNGIFEGNRVLAARDPSTKHWVVIDDVPHMLAGFNFMVPMLVLSDVDALVYLSRGSLEALNSDIPDYTGPIEGVIGLAITVDGDRRAEITGYDVRDWGACHYADISADTLTGDLASVYITMRLIVALTAKATT